MDLRYTRFLIVKPSSLGDIIHTLPLVHALRRCYPTCRIGWIVQQTFASLVECDPAVDHVYPISIPSTSDPQAPSLAYLYALRATVQTLRRLRRQFQQEPYDLVLDLHASFRSGLLGLANPGGTRVGFSDAKELNPLFQHQRIRVPASMVHAVDKNLLFCDYLNCAPLKEDFQLYGQGQDGDKVNTFLEGHGLSIDAPLVYINPAARWRTKFWKADRWAELADRLIDSEGLHAVFSGSENDRQYIVTITEKMAHRPIVAAGQFNLRETVSLIQRSIVYVGLDSGPMHMAAMAGVPVAALFGSTNPERVGPYGVEHQVIRAEGLDCLGCRRRYCSHLSCMDGISVDQVYDAVVTLCAKRPTSGVTG